jgi:hypothetical protein
MNPNLIASLLLNLAYALFALFAAGFLVDILPPALLDSGWIVASVTSLANLVIFPLLGLMLVHLAAYFSPTPRFQLVQQKLSSAAAIVAVGFFLLLPLMGFLVVKNGRTINSNNSQALARLSAKSAQLRTAVRDAQTPNQLQAAMLELQGPALDGNALIRPLPALKEQLIVVINQAERSFRDQIQGPYSPQNLPVLKSLLRTFIQCLIAGLGFAGLSVLPVAKLPDTKQIWLATFTSQFSLLKSKSGLKGFSARIQQFKQALKNRSNQAVAREGWKKMKDNQRKIFLEGEKAKKRNEAETRKHRERMKRQAEQRDKRKDWGR